ncbi:MAG: hypothetical protein IT214_10580 [Chitinophagaceae bacterium]|jgi:hypothetical protein|nr:hypothetical protein [Chitinophagaceae bacterium]OQY96848.1 MAG: hypothetical protein B6D37_00870 [Sphingobacteriales bacterium UTBCD1]
MEIKQISRRVVLTGTIIIWIIKFGLRPVHLFDGSLKFFLGIAPNLAGSFLIPFGAYWFFNGKSFLVARIFRIRSLYDLRMVCFIGFVLLVINEYLQLIPFFGRTFDYFDIFFSAVGLSGSYFVFGKLMSSYQPATN